MLARPPRAVPLTIVLGSASVALGIALLVGWTLLIVSRWESMPGAGSVWLLVAGIVSFVVIMAVLVLFSVTLVREIRSGLRQTSFIDSVTHELKSPLASIKLCLQTMERSDLTPDQRTDLQGMMKRDVDRLTVFIDDILQASRQIHRRGTIARMDVDVNAVVQSAVASILDRYQIPAESIRVDVPIGLHVFSDPTALETIVKNLLDNAAKYSDRPEGVEVVAGLDGRGRLCLEVRDQGVGIPAEALKRVFERFYRVPDEVTRSRRGTGLGLFVVRSLVRALGGHVEARSAGRGRGTTLRVVLPADPSGAPRAAPVVEAR